MAKSKPATSDPEDEVLRLASRLGLGAVPAALSKLLGEIEREPCSYSEKALGHAACLKGYSVLHTTAQDMVDDLHAASADGTERRAFRRYAKTQVVLIDEFGYQDFDSVGTKLLFRLVSARHNQAAILLAANTGFSNWKRFFPSEAQAVATVDRLIDRATILRFTGKSFRAPNDVHGAELDGES